MDHSGPIPNSYWVVPGQLLAGPRPTGPDRAASRAAVRALIDVGIGTVIDLRTAAEPPGIRSLLTKLSPEGEEVSWISAPIQDGDAPSESLLTLVLDLIDGSIARGRPVYVHCEGGLGRTGTIVGAYLIRHGLVEVDTVAQRLSDLRRGQPNASRPSPETPRQYRLLGAWSKRR